MQAYQFDRLINNTKIWMIIVIPLAIMIVIFGYLAYQMNDISVTLSAVLEQNSSLYETKTRGNLGLQQVEENSNNNGTNENSISEQLVLSNISSAILSEPPETGTSSGGQEVNAGISP